MIWKTASKAGRGEEGDGDADADAAASIPTRHVGAVLIDRRTKPATDIRIYIFFTIAIVRPHALRLQSTHTHAFLPSVFIGGNKLSRPGCS